MWTRKYCQALIAPSFGEASENIVGRGLHENKAAKMDLTMEEERPDITEEAPVSTVFVPPSIHRDDLLSGNSYSHYTPIPSLIRPSITSNESNDDDLAGTECVLGVDEAG